MTMGHDRTAALPVWRLRFEEHPGLEVRVTVPTVEALALAPKLLPLFSSGRQQDVVDAVARMAGPFADSLLSWTVQWKGRPVPCTRRGVLRVDLALILDVLTAWVALWPSSIAEPPEPDPEFNEDMALLAGMPMIPLDPDAEDAEPQAAPELVAVS